ncbi:Kinetochore protein Ndc80, partial [Cynara cardunculus var. scolymus]
RDGRQKVGVRVLFGVYGSTYLVFFFGVKGWSCPNKFEDDLFIVLKYLNCPIKMNKSALKAPGTPHSFPSVLAVLLFAMYNEHLENSTQSQSISGDSIFTYTLNTYLHYIKGDDDAMEREDDNFMEKLQQEKSFMEENVKDLEAKLEAMKSGPSPGEAKEEEKTMLEKDIKKFNELIEQLHADEELKKKVEEKCWDLNALIGTKFKELEALQIECNQAIRRLKLGNDFQYELNAKGSTPAEVLGMDYKSTLKPALSSSSDEVESHLSVIKNETQDYTSRCAMEARQLVQNFEAESHHMDVVEKEALELVENSKARLQETKKRSEAKQSKEEVETCGEERSALISIK